MKMIKPWINKGAVARAILGVCVAGLGFNASAQLTNLAQGKTVVTSSNENSNMIGSKIVDGDTSTKWGSNFAQYTGVDTVKRDSAWFYIDFGCVMTYDSLELLWEHSAAKEYKIQHSNIASANDQGWTTDTAITGEVYPWPDDGKTPLHRHMKFATPISARFLKIRCTKRNFQWGFSMWEMRVYNTLGPNRALNKSAFASSSNANAGPGDAVDGIMFYPAGTPQAGQLNFDSRWENNYGSRPDSLRGLDWLYVDLGAKYMVKYVVLLWEHSHSGDYVVQAWTKSGVPTAADTADANWTTLATEKNLTYSKPPDFCQGTYAVTPTETQFVRMHSYKKAQPYSEYQWGISVWEFEVYGLPASTSVIPEQAAKQAPASDLNILRSKDGVSIKAASFNVFTTEIFSPTGQLIRHLSGSKASFWNYRDSFGRSVMNGTYLIRVAAGDKTIQDKIAVYR